MLHIQATHSVFFFTAVLLTAQLEVLHNNPLPVFCLLLVMTIGVSHGSLDHLKGRQLSTTYGFASIIPFYLAYIMISAITIAVWMFNPSALLLLFLFIAAYHFGKEDADFAVLQESIGNDILFIFKGATVIAAPLYFQTKDTLAIFQSLGIDLYGTPLANPDTLLLLLCLGCVSSFLLARHNTKYIKGLLVLDCISIFICNYAFHPLVAFTLYFCGLHSIRHTLAEVSTLHDDWRKGVTIFVQKALPLTTAVGLAYLLGLYYLQGRLELLDAIYQVIFIGLAALTFPHLLLEVFTHKTQHHTRIAQVRQE